MITKETEENFDLVLKGFKTKAQVKAFINWYEGQGEQDASIWFEVLKEEEKLDVDFMPVDVNKKYIWEDNQLIAFLKIT